MNGADYKERRMLGRTGLSVGRLGLAAGYKVPAAAVEKAFKEYGVNYFYWETRKQGMKEGLRRLVNTDRDDLVIAIQSYDHTGFWLRRSVEKALRELKIDRVDILFLGWFNKMPNNRILAEVNRLKEDNKVRFLGMSGHNRRFHGEMAGREDSPFDVHMIRYSAAHRGAETEIFSSLTEVKPGITTYTATRWGKLISEKKMPPGEKPMTAAECYRFVLSHPSVDLCLAGPRNEREMEEGMLALTAGPLSPEELDRFRRIGDHVHG